MIAARTLAPGEKITEPGLFAGISMARYHSAGLCDGPSISSSGLRTIFRESPAHYWCTSPLNPKRIDSEETGALVLGRASHHLLLGEDDFSTLFIARPDKWDSWRTNDAKKWKAEQEADGRTVLLSGQLQQIRGMARALASHPLVQAGILNGDIERSLVWRCKETGYWKKARPDALPNDGDFSDLKTAISVSDDALRRTIFDYGLHQQGAMICEGYHALTGKDASSFTLVFIEKDEPHCVRIVCLRDQDLALGERQNFAAMKLFDHGIKTGEWPGPGRADAEYLGLPEWAHKQIDYQLEQMEHA